MHPGNHVTPMRPQIRFLPGHTADGPPTLLRPRRAFVTMEAETEAHAQTEVAPATMAAALRPRARAVSSSAAFVATVVIVFGLLCFFLGLLAGVGLWPSTRKTVVRATPARTSYGAAGRSDLRRAVATPASSPSVLPRRAAPISRRAVIDEDLLVAALQ
jgi:hypothetical protein